jgi:hypothetical protein
MSEIGLEDCSLVFDFCRCRYCKAPKGIPCYKDSLSSHHLRLIDFAKRAPLSLRKRAHSAFWRRIHPSFRFTTYIKDECAFLTESEFYEWKEKDMLSILTFPHLHSYLVSP